MKGTANASVSFYFAHMSISIKNPYLLFTKLKIRILALFQPNSQIRLTSVVTETRCRLNLGNQIRQTSSSRLVQCQGPRLLVPQPQWSRSNWGFDNATRQHAVAAMSNPAFNLIAQVQLAKFPVACTAAIADS